MKVTMQVVVSPPKKTAQIDFIFWLIMALLQESLVMINQCQLAFVVGKTDAKEASSVPRVHLSIRLFESYQRLNRLLNPKNVAA